MNSEGRGEIAPVPIWIQFARSDLVQIEGRAREQAMARDYRHRGDSWGRGLVGNGRPAAVADLRPEEYTVFLGIVGEWGCCVYINRRLGRDVARMDLTSRDAGDRGIDVTAFGLTIQVKTQQDPGLPGLVRLIDESGGEVPLASRVLVFARFDRARPVGVWLNGWVWTKDVLALPIVPARRGGHRNVEVPPSLYRPMSRLIHDLKARKVARQWR